MTNQINRFLKSNHRHVCFKEKPADMYSFLASNCLFHSIQFGNICYIAMVLWPQTTDGDKALNSKKNAFHPQKKWNQPVFKKTTNNTAFIHYKYIFFPSISNINTVECLYIFSARNSIIGTIGTPLEKE